MAEVNKPPQLGEALRFAAESGRQTKENTGNVFQALRENVRARIDAARNNFHAAREGLSRIRQETASVTKNAIDVAIGLASNIDARKAVGEALKYSYNQANERFDIKRNEILDSATDKKDAAIASAHNRISETAASARDRLISPQVNRAREIGLRLKTGGHEIVQFFRNQAENTKNGFMAKKAEIAADWHDILSKPNEIRANLLGKLGETVMNFANSGREAAQKRQSVADGYRGAAAQLRARTA